MWNCTFSHKMHDHLPLQRHLHLHDPGAHPGDTAGSHCKQTGYSLCAHAAHKLEAQKQENFFRLETPGFFCTSILSPFNTPLLPSLHRIFSPSCTLHSEKVDNKGIYQHCFVCSSTSSMLKRWSKYKGKAELSLLISSTCPISSNYSNLNVHNSFASSHSSTRTVAYSNIPVPEGHFNSITVYKVNHYFMVQKKGK